MFIILLIAFSFINSPQQNYDQPVNRKEIADEFIINTNHQSETNNITVKTSDIKPGGYYFGESLKDNQNAVNCLYFSLPQQQHIRISILNTIGTETYVLIDQAIEHGTYKISHNTNKYGNGVYFYKIETEYGTELRKFNVVN